jgi:hypothetical protein
MNAKSRLLTITFLAAITLNGASTLRSERSLLKPGMEQPSFQTAVSLKGGPGSIPPPCLPCVKYSVRMR